MNEGLKKQIIKYLDKYYYIKECLIFRKNGDIHEWGGYIAKLVSEIFSADLHDCLDVVMVWVRNQPEIKPSDITNLWQARKLKFVWSIEMADELRQLGVSNVQRQMNDLVINGLSKEIDTTILEQLKEDIKNDDELKSLIKCIGYTTSPIVYNAVTLKPEQQFISVRYHEMINERQSNNIWQNHFRPTRVDEQTQVTS